MISNHELPKVSQLHDSDEIAFKHSALLNLLNKPVHQSWVKKHKTIRVEVNGQYKPLEYLPIDKVRFLLTRIFGLFWQEEIIRYSTDFNSCTVQVRLHYCVPQTDIWLYKDGIGAVGVQTDKGANASDIGAIKSNAVMLAMPAAASYALSNAAEKLGRIFGADLNKSDIAIFSGIADAYADNGTSKPAQAPQPQPQFQPQPQYQQQFQPHPQPTRNGWQPDAQQGQLWSEPAPAAQAQPQAAYDANSFFSNL